MEDVLVSIVIATHNGAEYMDGLCTSLLKAVEKTRRWYELVIVDNGSKDATCSIIEKYFPDAKKINLNKNTGFSCACNSGAKKACGKYLFFLNQDMEIHEETLSNLLEISSKRKDAGLFGAKIKFANHPEIINSFGHAMNRIGFAWDYGIGEVDGKKFGEEREAPGVCGGALFIRRDLFLSLGGFDEKFFMYGEDVDLGLRVMEAGYKILAVPDAVVFHHKNLFSGNARHFEFLDQKNRWRIVLKNFPSDLLGDAVIGGMRFDLISLFRFLIRCEINKFFYRFMAVICTILNLPEMLWKRRGRKTGILFKAMSGLIKEGRGYPNVDVGYLVSKYEQRVGNSILKENLKKEKIDSPQKILLLRGPDHVRLKETCDILKELYPEAEVTVFVGDRRITEGFKGAVLEIPREGSVGYLFRLWLRIFRKFDLVLILRKDALFKMLLALFSFPRVSFTVDNVGRLEKVSFLRILREVNLIKLFWRSLKHFLKKCSLKIIYRVGEVIFFLAGLRGKNLNKILFIQLGQLGDLILETAAVEAVRKKFKDARIISLVAPWGEEFVNRDPMVDKVIVYSAGWLRPDYKNRKNNSKGLLRTLMSLWRERINLVIDFRGEANSIILGYLSGARLRLGYAIRSEDTFLPLEEVKFLQNLNTEFPWQKRHDFHQVEHNFRLLKKIGIEGNFKPRAFFNEEEKKWAKYFLKSEENGHVVIVHPGSSRIEKTWAPKKFATLIERLQGEDNAMVVIVGEKSELELGEKIISLLKEKPLLAVGKTTLGRLAALINEADIFIGNESGPMHIAASLSIPTIAIMSGVPSLYGPYRTLSRVVQKKLPCWHPWIEHCWCPQGRYQCLEEIEVEDVWKEVKAILQSKRYF